MICRAQHGCGGSPGELNNDGAFDKVVLALANGGGCKRFGISAAAPAAVASLSRMRGRAIRRQTPCAYIMAYLGAVGWQRSASAEQRRTWRSAQRWRL